MRRKKVIDKLVEALLSEDIFRHEHDQCNCHTGINGDIELCYAGEWLENCLSSKEVLKDMLDITDKQIEKIERIK